MGDRIISAKLKELSRNWANSSAGEKVEILDLSDPTKQCALLNDIYPARYSGAGGLLGKNHLLVIDFIKTNFPYCFSKFEHFDWLISKLGMQI